jgi:hypothetical protein
MIRKTKQTELRSNPTWGPFVRVQGNTITDSGTRKELADRNPANLTARDRHALIECGEFFFNHLLEMSMRPEVQKAADNLASLMSWAKDSEKFDQTITNLNYQPLTLLAMGIVIGLSPEIAFPVIPEHRTLAKSASAGK